MPEGLSETISKRHENTCQRIYQKLYQNVMKHMPANLQMNMVTFNTSNLIYSSDSLLCASASWFLHILRTCIDKMVNWKDPALLLNDSGASCGLYVGQYCHRQSPSRFYQINSCHWWHLHVCSSLLAGKRKLIFYNN